MAENPPARIAFLGCGNIAGPYAAALAGHPELALVGAFDIDTAKCGSFAAAQHCRAYASIDALCADHPDIVVNLTSAPYHYATTRDLIARGQTVFSEKPMALEYREAAELVALARDHRVRLGSAPSIWLGDAQLRAARAVMGGAAGTIRLISAEVNQGRIESWHPAPQTFYRFGPVFDVGVYPLAYLTAIFGPIRAISATSTTALARRTTLAGEPFDVESPDAWVIMANFETGPLLRLSCNFFVDSSTVPRHIDFHGDTGSFRLDDWILPGAGLSEAAFGKPYQAVTAASAGTIDWCLGVADLATAIRTGRPHRNSGEHGAHVVEVLEAVAASARTGQRVAVQSSFPNPLSDFPSSTQG